MSAALFAETVEAFAHSLGARGYACGEGDRMVLELERSGRLGVERVDEDVLVYLVRDHGRAAAGLAARALVACHPRERHRWPLQTARVSGESLLFAFRLPLARADVPALVASLDALNALHERLGTEGRA